MRTSPNDIPQALGELISRNSSRSTRLLDVLMQDLLRAAMGNGTAVPSRADVHSAARLVRAENGGLRASIRRPITRFRFLAARRANPSRWWCR